MFAGAFAKCWRVPLLPRNGEMCRISIKLCRFPGSRDNSRIRDNVFRFQRRLSERLVTAFGCTEIKKWLMDGNLARLDRRKRNKFFTFQTAHFSISWQQRYSPAFCKHSSEHLPHLQPYERIKHVLPQGKFSSSDSSEACCEINSYELLTKRPDLRYY